VRGAKQAVYILRNADRVSNFCNDVIGDISGIVSGAAATFVVLELLTSLAVNSNATSTVVNVIFAGLVSALTVGGKALGKSVAISNSTSIVLMIGKFFYFLESRLNIRIFKNGKRSKSGKRGKKHAARTNQPT
jgi:CBS domain containing-hemolysin-like protein